MCGICGIALADSSGEVGQGQLAAMCDVLAHRGPDAGTIRLFGHVGFGHRRLSIVDLADGHQPMANEDGSVWVTYNGEIYNHAGFRPQLAARGHRYRTRCDTEVILHLYEEQGERFAAALRGMFALAVWDERRETLVLARDHLGIKPLYYAHTAGGDLVFGSEIKALFASGMIEPALDPATVPEYFATGQVAGSRTLYRGVCKLEPAEVLIWRQGRVRRCTHWSLADEDLQPSPRATPTIAVAGREFWTRFQESVQLQLMSDVPLGVFLSGGLDSSLIVAAMRRCGVQRLKTFSVGFAEREANELPHAQRVAAAFTTDHREVRVTAASFFEAIPQLTWHRDAPLTFPASVPLYFVSRLAAAEVKVVLTGEGSDELFAGYGRYLRGMWNLRLAAGLDRWLPRTVRDWLAAAAGRAGDGYVGSRLQRSFLGRRGDFAAAYLDAFSEVAEGQRRRLLGAAAATNAFRDTLRYLDRGLLRENPLEAMLRFDQATYLQELLAKQDRMSMAASLESRVPYLDHRLAAWAAQLAPGLKLRRLTGKAVVRAAAAGILPRSVIGAAKRGFPVPLGAWFGPRGRGREWLEEYAPRPGDELLDADHVRRLIAEQADGRDRSALLWRLLAFQVWRREVVPRARALYHAAPTLVSRCSAT